MVDEEYGTEGYEARVINSHVIKCPVCDGDQGVVVVWSDGDVDLLCMGCKHKERSSVE